MPAAKALQHPNTPGDLYNTKSLGADGLQEGSAAPCCDWSCCKGQPTVVLSTTGPANHLGSSACLSDSTARLPVRSQLQGSAKQGQQGGGGRNRNETDSHMVSVDSSKAYQDILPGIGNVSKTVTVMTMVMSL